MRRRTFVLFSFGVLTSAPGCLGGADEAEESYEDLSEEATIEIDNSEFVPRMVQIAPGGTVTWKNTGDASHRVDAFQFQASSEGWSFRETLEPGESVTYTFEEEGRYDFTDQAYGQFSMCGRIRVGHVDEGGSLPCK